MILWQVKDINFNHKIMHACFIVGRKILTTYNLEHIE